MRFNEMEKWDPMDINIEPELLGLISAVEADLSKAVSEALRLWLRQKLPQCPITNGFCTNLKGSCNNCSAVRNQGDF